MEMKKVADAGDAALEAPPSGRRRYLTAFLCLCVATVCYADRTNMGIALPAFISNKQEQGEVLSAFFYGYMCTQAGLILLLLTLRGTPIYFVILGGYFATKLGAKWVLLTGVVVWTLFDLSTVLVAKCLTCLFFTRAGMGLGEGILFPCMHQIAGAWYPLQERSRLVSLVASGSDLGTITALVVSPAILEASNWQRIFLVFGVLSFLWVVVFMVFGVSRPEDDPHITPQERAYILRNRTIDPMTHHRQRNLAELDTNKMNWRVLLTSRPAWAIYVAHICYNYSWYVLLGWIPQYFHDHLHIDLGKHGVAAALPYACGYVGTLLFGRVGDHLVSKNYRELHVRRLMNGIGFLGSAFFLYSLRFARTSTEAVALLSLTLFSSRATMAGYWVNMIDIAPNHAAHIMGVSNTFATVPGIIGNVVTGKILEATGGWDLVFAIAALVLVFGAVFFHCNASDKSIYNSRNVTGSGYLSTTSTRSASSREYGLPSARSDRRDDEVGLLEEQ